MIPGSYAHYRTRVRMYIIRNAPNGRGCRRIEAVNAPVLARAALRMCHRWVRVSRERQNRPYTLHPTLIDSNHTMELRILIQRRAASTFALCLFSFVIRHLFACGGRALAAIIWQQAAAVSTQYVRLDRHRHSAWLAVRCAVYLSQPPHGLSAQLLKSADQPTNP